MFPQAIINTRAFVLGPSTGGKIQLRINGPDPEELRKLGAKVEDIVLADPVAKGVRKRLQSREPARVSIVKGMSYSRLSPVHRNQNEWTWTA